MSNRKKLKETEVKRPLPDPVLVAVDEEAERLAHSAMEEAANVRAEGVAEHKQKNIQELLDELDAVDLTDPEILADYVGDMMLVGLLAQRDVELLNEDTKSKTEALAKLDEYIRACVATLGFIPSKKSASYLVLLGKTMPPTHPTHQQVMTSIANVGSHFAIITRETMILRRQLLKVDEDKANL